MRLPSFLKFVISTSCHAVLVNDTCHEPYMKQHNCSAYLMHPSNKSNRSGKTCIASEKLLNRHGIVLF